jgi:hypothetical protein
MPVEIAMAMTIVPIAMAHQPAMPVVVMMAMVMVAVVVMTMVMVVMTMVMVAVVVMMVVMVAVVVMMVVPHLLDQPSRLRGFAHRPGELSRLHRQCHHAEAIKATDHVSKLAFHSTFSLKELYPLSISLRASREDA